MPTEIWDQRYPYNLETPTCSGIQLPPGCGALAVSQVLYYYQYPNYNFNVNERYIVGCPSSFDFRRSFDRNNFTLNFNNHPQLIADVGKIINTYYLDGSFARFFGFKGSQGTSSIFDIRSSLSEVFGFDESIQYARVEDHPISTVKNTIYENLNKCQPVIFIGQNPTTSTEHIMVIDDYNSNGDFHVNFGDGGETNSFQSNVFIDPFDSNSSNIYTENMIIVFNILPSGFETGCEYFLSNPPTYSITGSQSRSQFKSGSCNQLVYPSQNLENNIILLGWESPNNPSKYKIKITDISSGQILYNEYTYFGLPHFYKNDYFAPNSILNIEIREENISGNLICVNNHTINSSNIACNLNIDYIDKYCINDGTQYVLEVNFIGQNTAYDIFADWDGQTLDSKDDVPPGFYILGPFDINQNVGIVVEDISNPFNCFDTELVIAPPIPSNCVPNPITQNNGGSSQNPPVSCSSPGNFNLFSDGNQVTYNWNGWTTNAENLIIELSYDQVTAFDSHVISNDGSTSYSVQYDPCQEFYARARFDCGQNFSNYTPYRLVDLSPPSCNPAGCSLPSNVNEQLINSSTQWRITWSNPDSQPHEVCLISDGNSNCFQASTGQTSMTFNISNCINYSYKIRKECTNGINSNYINGPSIRLGSVCGNLPELDIRSNSTDPFGEYTAFGLRAKEIHIENHGNVPTGSSFGIGLYVQERGSSNNPKYLIASRTINNISANSVLQGFDLTQSFENLAFLEDGIYRLIVKVDYLNKIAEVNENNNEFIFIDDYDLVKGCNDDNAHGNTIPSHTPVNFDQCFYCNDGIQNGNETGIDCGGMCGPCCDNIYYRDVDGDGFGNDNISVVACNPPNGYVSNGIDCNDNNSNIYPGNVESCDNIDNDCNMLTDECCESYYVDNDGDGFGSNTTVESCTQLFNYVTNNTDCNDNNSNIYPGAPEICDGVDNNCVSGIDEGSVCTSGQTCVNAIELNLGGNYYSDGPNSGNGANNIDSNFPSVEHADWYYFDAYEDGSFIVQSCNYGVDTRLLVYTGTCGNLIPIHNSLDEFDDECALSNTDLRNYASFAEIDMECGKRYYIEWDDRWSENSFSFDFYMQPYYFSCHTYGSEYLENFEEDNTSLVQVGCNDDLNWIRQSGPPPSRANGHQTGPSSAFSGNYYYYVEASTPNHPSKRAVFYTPCYDLSFLNFPSFSFRRHMFGSDVGELTIEISEDLGNSWQQLNTFLGDFGDTWLYYGFNLTTTGTNHYANKTVRFRITATTGNSFLSDIAIDDIRLEENCLTEEIVDYDITSNYRYIEALNLIRGNKKISSNSSTTFDSGNIIELESGFEVVKGATFLAKIDGCDTNLNSFQQNSVVKN